MKYIELPTSLKYLGEYCFLNCTSLTSIELPSSIVTIGTYCFRNCNSLSSIILPESIYSIGNYCFHNCSSLTSIQLPKRFNSFYPFKVSYDEYLLFSKLNIKCKSIDFIHNNSQFFNYIPDSIPLIVLPPRFPSADSNADPMVLHAYR